MQKILLLLATVLTLPPALALGQTTEELNSDRPQTVAFPARLAQS